MFLNMGQKFFKLGQNKAKTETSEQNFKNYVMVEKNLVDIARFAKLDKKRGKIAKLLQTAAKIGNQWKNRSKFAKLESKNCKFTQNTIRKSKIM